MARKTSSDERREVRARSQTKSALTETRRDNKTGKFMEAKADPKPFKGVRKEKPGIKAD